VGDARVQLGKAQLTALDHRECLADAALAGCRKLDAALGVPVDGVEGYADVPREGLAAALREVEPAPAEGSAERLPGHAFVRRDGLSGLARVASTDVALPAKGTAALRERPYRSACR
jgi:hypothetical protein